MPRRLVLYVPSATALTSGGYFVPRASAATPPGAQAPPSSPNSPTSATPASGRKAASYDTILSAQHILLGMQQVCTDGVKTFPQTAVLGRATVLLCCTP
eukprot:1160007-Pelagomonas_calceolata.AAC.6